MSGHTPGPWEITNLMDVFTTTRHGDSNDGHQIADCGVDFDSDDNPGLSHEEQKANARLIASAPDLLEALKGLLEVLERNMRSTLTAKCESPIGRAKAAIAKAEGKE